MSAIADTIGIIISSIAIWTYLFHKKEFSQLLRILTSFQSAERTKKIRETLGRLDGLSYDNKPDRPEIKALFGQLSGQLKLLAGSDPRIAAIDGEIQSVLNRSINLTESLKRKIAHEIHGHLDAISVGDITSAAGVNDEQ